MAVLRLVLGDQLSHSLSSLEDVDDDDGELGVQNMNKKFIEMKSKLMEIRKKLTKIRKSKKDIKI